MSRRLRKLATIVEAPAATSTLGAELQNRVATGLRNTAELQEEVAAMWARRRKKRDAGEPMEMIDVTLARLGEESTWRGAAILEHVQAAVLTAERRDDSLKDILENIKRLKKKGKPRQ
jgi:hypothetical protein